ncbi:MAG: carbohydrate porin [Chroococcidiopsidaceae cyanobacterium CP_BM_ER_R8_30]|nr:carbohydrate porin [Chroococcidiopsidaceae cyanobacterium CP_BM_ER_R8_30]
MKWILAKAVLASLLISGVTSLTCATAIANEDRTTGESMLQQGSDPVTYGRMQPVEQFNSVSQFFTNAPTQPVAQLTSVSQLSDVQPTDWAFQALQSLVERYGCIAGYPNGTFRGNRALTRYEFAAGLSACLDRVNELIAAGTTGLVRKEDLMTLQRLQQEFGTELAHLRGRVDAVEAQTAQLEANQFSTTTKLVGRITYDVNGGTSTARNVRDPNATSIVRATLNFVTSFTGKDQLLTQFITGVGSPVDNAPKYFAGGGTFSGLDFGGQSQTFKLRRLRYNFPVGKDLQVSVFARGNISDFVDLNSYANIDSKDFSGAWDTNDYLVLAGSPAGPGLALTYSPNQGPFTITATYQARNGNTPIPQGRFRNGIFGDPYISAAEIAFSPSKNFAARVLYTYGSDSGDRFSGIGFNFEYAIVKKCAIFGRFGHVFNYAPSAIANTFGDPGQISGDTITNRARPNYWMAGVAFPDLFITGALAGVAVGEPFIDNSIGNVTQKNLEAFYRYPINAHITVTPSFQVFVNPGNLSTRGTAYVGSIRTVFDF